MPLLQTPLPTKAFKVNSKLAATALLTRPLGDSPTAALKNAAGAVLQQYIHNQWHPTSSSSFSKCLSPMWDRYHLGMSCLFNHKTFSLFLEGPSVYHLDQPQTAHLHTFSKQHHLQPKRVVANVFYFRIGSRTCFIHGRHNSVADALSRQDFHVGSTSCDIINFSALAAVQ